VRALRIHWKRQDGILVRDAVGQDTQRCERSQIVSAVRGCWLMKTDYPLESHDQQHRADLLLLCCP
jgi:hypothetical protein